MYYTDACKNCELETGEANILKTPKEDALLPGSFASAEAVAHIAIQKFVMYSPLYRAERSIKPFVVGRQKLAVCQYAWWCTGQQCDLQSH